VRWFERLHRQHSRTGSPGAPAQWNFEPAPGRWSIAECAGQIAVTEDFYFDLVANQLAMQPVADVTESG
jgi:hypothetical protein